MIHNLAADQYGFTSNAFLVTGERPVLVDPGSNFDVVTAVREHARPATDTGSGTDAGTDTGSGTDAGIAAVILTHSHPDHVGNVGDVVEAFGVDVWGYDQSLPYVDHGVSDGDHLRMGDHEYVSLSTPGHADDHLCYFSRAAGVLFAGDLVFANGGFGRTDLEGGDRTTLRESIDYVLDTVGEDLRELHTGHGPSVTSSPRRDVELAAQVARTR